MKRFNILYLANSGDIIGGGEISLLGLLAGVSKESFNPLVICPSMGNLLKELEQLNIETNVVQMKSLRRFNPFSNIDSIAKLGRVIKSRKIDLVHANGSRSAFYGGIASRIAKVPLVWHVRILESDGLVDRLLASLSNKIVVNSKAVKARFNWLKDEAKVEVIYNGIDLERFHPFIKEKEVRDEFGLSQEALLVGTVGRLDWYKAHQYLLQAAKKVVEVISDIHFLIIGDGDCRGKLEDLKKKLRLNKNLIFTGNRKDIPRILSNLDLFVLSSVSEGFGRSVAEAMACEVPVVATKVGGIPEVVEDGVSGCLVPSKDPAALAEVIINLLKDREKAKAMGQAGRRRVEELFSIQRNVKKTEQLYEKILLRKT